MKRLLWPQKSSSELQGENFLLSMLNSLNDVVFVLNEQHQIQFINQHWFDLTGFSSKDTYGLEFSAFLHPEDKQKWFEVLQKIQPDQTELLWVRLITQHQEVRWCELHTQTMQPDTVYPLSATLFDITPQIREKQINHANHRSLQSLVDRMPAMLYRSRNNKSWTLEYVSEGCELLTGYSAEALLNQSQVCLGSIIHADDAEPVWEQVQLALQTQSNFELRYRITQANGNEIIVRDKGRGLYSDSGMVLGVEGIVLQISE